MPAFRSPAKMAVIYCMDPRIQLSRALGSRVEEAFILRNGGGRVTDDVVRSLVLCTRLLNVTEIAVIHHTDCRLQEFSNEELSYKTGVDIDFMSFSTPTVSVSQDIARLRTYDMFNNVKIWGGIYSVSSHTIRPIADAHNGTILFDDAEFELSE
jgi:carbonic anhydrase